MTEILSRQNPKIKTARALARAARRSPRNLMLVEGIRHVGEAVDSGWNTEFILYCPELLTSDFAENLLENLPEDTPAYTVSEDILVSIANKKNPQGILAVVHKPSLGLEEIRKNNWQFLVGLERPQDPGNVGTVLRTLDAAGADALVIIGGGTNPYHPKAVRAGMGAHFHIPLIEISTADFLDWQAYGGFQIIGTSAKAREDYRTVEQYELPLMLLMGTEREGLSLGLVEACNRLIKIPMWGRASSLNLAVSTGILIYQIANQVRD